MKRFVFAMAVGVAVWFGACASRGRLSIDKPFAHVSYDARLDAIRRAQVWEATDVASMDLRTGPKGSGSFTPEETVRCTFIQKKMGGNSPKFHCVIPPDDEV